MNKFLTLLLNSKNKKEQFNKDCNKKNNDNSENTNNKNIANNNKPAKPSITISKRLLSYALSILIRLLVIVIVPLAISFIIMILISNAQAEQVKIMKGDDQASVVISKNDLNRIKLINDKIKSLRYNQGELTITQDSNLGEAYIRTSRTSKKNVNLFITSQKGYVYKILLTLKNIPSEQIFIKNNKNYFTSSNDSESSFSDNAPIEIKFEDSYKSGIIDLIKAMTFRDRVNGFYIMDRGGDRVRFKRGFKIKWETSYISNHRNNVNNLANLTGEIFSVKNITNKPIELKEQDFLKRGIIAVKLDNLKLNPDEITSLYLVGGNK